MFDVSNSSEYTLKLWQKQEQALMGPQERGGSQVQGEGQGPVLFLPEPETSVSSVCPSSSSLGSLLISPIEIHYDLDHIGLFYQGNPTCFESLIENDFFKLGIHLKW